MTTTKYKTPIQKWAKIVIIFNKQKITCMVKDGEKLELGHCWWEKWCS
jgi:hypothetical protein